MNKPHDTDLWQKAAQLAELLQQPGISPTETILGFLEALSQTKPEATTK
jgi:hypothetical protein